MPQYMLLLYDNPADWTTISPEEMQKAIEKYVGWSKKAFNVTNKRLAPDTGKVLRGTGGNQRVKDGPYSETKEVLGGFYLIEAANYEEAVQRSLDHPHLEYGGTIELRALYAM